MDSTDSLPCVLLISKAYPPVVGGVETYAEEVAKAYLSLGFKPVVLTQTTGPTGLRTIPYVNGGIDLYNINSSGDSVDLLKQRNQPASFFRLLRAVPKLLRQYPVAFIHCTTWRPALAAIPFLGALPLVISIHGREILNFPSILRPALSLIAHRASLIVAVSDATLAIAGPALGSAVISNKGVRAFNGISFPQSANSFYREQPNPQTTINVLTVSRLAERKNVHSCLIAMSRLRERGIHNFHYTIAGKGPLLSKLRQLASDLSLDEQVTFLGYVPDAELPGLYMRSDIFLHPQTSVGEGIDFEGFGLVIADAMSFGCVVIVGKDGGPKDFVSHGMNGFVVDGLDVDSIVSSLEVAITQKDTRAEISKQARAFSLRELSWHNHAETIIHELHGATGIS